MHFTRYFVTLHAQNEIAMSKEQSNIADDKVGLQISRYQLQYIAMDELIRQLSFIRPTFQYFFGTERAIRLLHKIENK